jgi:iron(III) transport system substrate-binding protein
MKGHWFVRGPRILSLVAALCLVAAACSGGSSGSSSSGGGDSQGGGAAAARKAVCDAGAKEGKLVYWNNLAKPDDIIEKFNEEYPDIDVQSTTLRPDDSAQRVAVEHSAGRAITADIIYGGIDVWGSAIKQGLIDTSVDWTSLGVPADHVTQDTHMIRIFRVAAGITYNTDKLKATDLPDKWEDLVDPKWANKIIVDPRGRPFDQLALDWGEAKVTSFVQQFKQVDKPVIVEGGTAGLVAVAGGQGLFTTGGRSAETEQQKQKGAPLEIKYLDLVPTFDSYHGLIKGAAHPNAAKCFMAWDATDGAAFHLKTEVETNEDLPPGTPAGAKLLTTDTPQKADLVADMSKKVGDLLEG